MLYKELRGIKQIMNEESYYEEIEHLIKRNEVNKRVRKKEEENDTVTTYWSVGKLIVEAQGGSKRAKYGNELIKKWSIKLTEAYGKGYNDTNLKRFRQFYLYFEKSAAVRHQISWTHYKRLLPIKDENKRNYYINLCIKNHLSERELGREIKSNSYERLINKPDKIDIIVPIKPTITTDMKNPIIIPIDKKVTNEYDLELNILAHLDYFFKQLGQGFAYIAHQYKLVKDKHSYFVDILLFNIKLNCYVVVELKLRSLKKEDKAQIEFYMKLVDDNVKEVLLFPKKAKNSLLILSKEKTLYP